MEIKWEELQTKRRKSSRDTLECLRRHNWQYEPAAKELGVTNTDLSNMMHNMRRAGVISGRPTCGLIAEQIRAGRMRLGDYRSDFKMYEIGFQRWLCDQIPSKEVSLLDQLLSIAYDTYAEEKDEKARKAA